MRYFFIDASEKLVSGKKIIISGSDVRHIKNVLRYKPGDFIGLLNGMGAAFEARITGLSKTEAEAVVVRQLIKKPGPELDLSIAQALLKDRKMTNLIRPLTELGATSFCPFISHRSIPRPDKNRQMPRADRWKKIARESLKQCRRGQPMTIKETASFDVLLSRTGDRDLKIVFWEDAEEALPSVVAVNAGMKFQRILAVLGPEGGFTKEEVNTAQNAGFIVASLGPRILRAETAAVTACALLQYIFGDMG